MSDREVPEFVRKAAHAKLDQLLQMYESGAPLQIVSVVGWHTPRLHDEIQLTIRESGL